MMRTTQRTTAPGGASSHAEARARAASCLTPPSLTATVRLILLSATSTMERQMLRSSPSSSGAPQTLQRCVSLGQPDVRLQSGNIPGTALPSLI